MFSQTNACFDAFQLSFHAVAFKLEPNSNSKGDRVVREASVSSEMHSFVLNLAKLSLILFFSFHEWKNATYFVLTFPWMDIGKKNHALKLNDISSRHKSLLFWDQKCILQFIFEWN